MARPIMAICTDAGRCGCAIYTDTTLQLIADRTDSGNPYKNLEIVIQRIDPEFVVISSVQKKLIDYLEKSFQFKVVDISKKFDRRAPKQTTQLPPHLTASQSASYVSNTQTSDSTIIYNQLISESTQIYHQELATHQSQTEETDNYAFTLMIVPNMWFCMSRGMLKLTRSEFVTSKGLETYEEKLLYVSTKVKKSVDVCAVRAVSALEEYIIDAQPNTVQTQSTTRSTQRNSTQTRSYNTSQSTSLMNPHQVNRNIPDNLMPILEIKYIEPGPVMSIDKITLESLGIFDKTKRKSETLEGYEDDETDQLTITSLYTLLNECSSSPGRRQLKTMMLWPLQDQILLGHRYDTIEYFMNPLNRVIRDQLSAQLRNVSTLNGLLNKLNQSVGSYKDLFKIYKSLWAFLAIIDLVKADCQKPQIEIFKSLISCEIDELRVVVDSIMNVVDFDSSKRENRIQISSGVDEDIDNKVDILNNMHQFCEEVANQETALYKDILGRSCRVLYIPRIGFLCSSDYTSDSELKAIRNRREFDILLYTESCIYYKTKKMEELDLGAGDIACDLIDVQEKVLVELQSKLLKHLDIILRLKELCGQLDCLIAFSLVSLQRGYTRPEIIASDENMMIQQSYHPLASTGFNIVPNDADFYREKDSRQPKVMIITGPNSSGKSTYIKSVCLIVYMAHIGCFVPATRAKIPIVDAILTRIHGSNSVSTGLSTFALDLHQINFSLARSSERSLVAIDEFGEGTQACDGFHLLKGLIMHFVLRAQKCPYVMIATHFNRIIDHLQNYSMFILYKTFRVTRDLTRDSVVYEYKLVDGVCEASLADEVASRAGVPSHIIARAKQIKSLIVEGRQIGPRPPCGA